MTTDCDVAVIGGGIVGCAIARELAAHELRIVLLEGRDDVGDGTSKANTALLHTGFDAVPGTLESRLVRRGHGLLRAYAAETGIPVERTGALLIAWSEAELAALPGLEAKARENGYGRCTQVTADEVYRRVPRLGPGVRGAIQVPDESIICTWTTNLALATDAIGRGVAVNTGHRVLRVAVMDGVTVLHTSGGEVRARLVVNAAGLGSDLIDRLFGHDRFTVIPRRGELLVFDKLARPLVDQILLAVPGRLGKGVLISPTIYGNVMLGPTAEDVSDPAATGTSEAGLAFLREQGMRLMPALMDEEVTATYAGLRAAITGGDYLIELDVDRRYLLVGGIRSTGLTSGMAIAEHVAGLLDDAGLLAPRRGAVPPPPRMPNLGENGLRPYADGPRIAVDPAYGEVVCFCERVTAGEIRDALHGPLPARDLGGLRRRTRAMNGRCQGFYCGAEIAARLADRLAAGDRA